MFTERMLSTVVRHFNKSYMQLTPAEITKLPAPDPAKTYMLYAHIPFCERLCPYCSFNRFPYSEKRGTPYFENLRKEMRMLKDLGYDFKSLYLGGGTPTIMLDELCETIDLAKEMFSIVEVSSETNPNHLLPEYVEKLAPRVQRFSVGVQSFDNGLLKQMDRYDKYGSAEEVFERIQWAAPKFESLNVDMIFNFPSQTRDMLENDVEKIIASGASQTTFYPLMASPVVAQSLKRTVGEVSYAREADFYNILCDGLTGAEDGSTKGVFEPATAWTFSRTGGGMIDEYIVDYEEYAAVGSGAFSFMDGSLFVNTFSLKEHAGLLDQDRMSIVANKKFTKHGLMQYRFMMQLFGLRLDKREFKRDFGVSVEQGLPAETMFMRATGAYATDNADEITLTRKGRYYLVAMMREFFIGVNGVRDQARAALTGEEKELIFGDGKKGCSDDAGEGATSSCDCA